MSHSFESQLLYRLSGGDMSWQLADGFAESQRRQKERDLDVVVGAIREQARQGAEVQYRVSQAMQQQARQRAEAMQAGLAEVGHGLHGIADEVSQVGHGVSRMLREQVATNDAIGQLLNSVKGLGTQLSEDIAELRDDIRAEGDATREQAAKLADRAAEMRRREKSYTYRALKVKAEHETVKAVQAVELELEVLTEQFQQIYFRLNTRFHQLQDELLIEEKGRVASERRRLQLESRAFDVHRQQAQRQIEDLRPQAEAPVTGLFGLAEQRSRKAAAAAKIEAVSQSIARIDADRAATDRQLAALPSLGAIRRNAALRAREQAAREFLATPLGQEVLQRRMAKYRITVPEIDYDICVTLDEMGKADYPGLGPVPSREETLERLSELKVLSTELRRSKLDDYARGPVPLPLSMLRRFFSDTPTRFVELYAERDVPEEDPDAGLLDSDMDDVPFGNRFVSEVEPPRLDLPGTNWIASAASTIASAAGEEADADPLYDEAVQVVREHQRAAIALVQRNLRIGYNRAARLLEAMEANGVVSAMDIQGNRQVLS